MSFGLGSAGREEVSNLGWKRGKTYHVGHVAVGYPIVGWLDGRDTAESGWNADGAACTVVVRNRKDA